MMINKKILHKYNVPVPRYTSYPPANHFRNEFKESDYIQLIEDSNTRRPGHIAIYIHIPFCKKICFYCGCNACTIKSDQLIIDYFEALKNELELVTKYLDTNRKVSQVHFGGGTPNAVNVKFLEKINELIFNKFEFIDHPEIAIECNPAYLNYEYMDQLLAAGFNRFSLGIQDFNQDVLKAVNRSVSEIPVDQLVKYLKKSSTATVNLDFIYGLPGQSKVSFYETIEKAIQINPDRLVTFSYAHVPWLKKHQEILTKKGLPSSEEKMQMFLTAREILIKGGYIPVGLDHYVLPGDELSVALKNNQLHRNFQGYCTRRTTGQVYAFGVSAISQLENAYIQNVKEVETYIQKIKNKKLPIEKGLVLHDEQIIVRELITKLMCNQQLNLKKIADDFDIDLYKLKSIVRFTDEKLQEFINDGLLTFNDDEIKVTETGSLFIRNIATLFDPLYTKQKNKYSKTV